MIFQQSTPHPSAARVNIIRVADPDAEENQTAVLTIQAQGAGTMTYAIEAGLDGALFSIVGATGVLTFAAPPDFETPADADEDNVYEVIVSATNDGDPMLADQTTIFVTVTDVAE